MQIDDYAEFFNAIHGKTPFPWQARLAARVVRFGWGAPNDPQNTTHGTTNVLALPTAAGKTSVIDITVFHLAFQLATNAQPRTAPLRVFFVIDRRIVVDEAHARARRIAAALRNATSGILKQAADALRHVGSAVGVDDPLHVAMMRGGMYRDDGWARSPAQPTICVSTVDQVGSRLLFRGYGLSEFQRPIHAGLIGCDSLIILDEAHISNPFLETLSAVQRYAGPDWFEVRPPLVRSVQVVQMTATPRSGTKPFTINQADRDDAVLNARLTASKPATLIPVETKPTNKKMPPAQRREIKAENTRFFTDRIVEEAVRLAGPQPSATPQVSEPPRKRRRAAEGTSRGAPPAPPVGVVGIVVNRVAVARRVFEALQALRDPAGNPAVRAVLLTGRVRPYDRDELLHRASVNGQPAGWLRFIRADREGTDQLALPLFVVATQAIEVGADLSFDALVTEIASLDALRQRFGRLDRLGRRRVSPAVVIARNDNVARNAEPDPVYGESLPRCWRQLDAWSDRQPRGRSRTKILDFGIDALERKIEQLKRESPTEFDALCSPLKHAPVMLPAHVDTWCQTSPTPTADPDVGLFLHGPASGPADVQVVWRGDLPVQLSTNELQRYIAIVNLVPPTSLEVLSVPIYHVRAWLLEKALTESLTDVEGATMGDGTDERASDSRGPRVLRWCGPDEPRTRLITADQIRPGDTIVVPAQRGGCDEFGWNPSASGHVRDVGDPAARTARWRPVLRLQPSVLGAWFWPARGGEADHTAFADRVTAKWRLDEDDEREVPNFDGVLETLRDDPDTPAWARRVAAELLGEKNRRPPEWYSDDSGWLLEHRRRLTREQIAASGVESDAALEQNTESDESSMTGWTVTLTQHCKCVQRRTQILASATSLPEELRDDLALAAWLHDVGKADPRFQIWLNDGDEIAAAMAEALLAKSGRSGRNAAAVRRARERAGYPAGGRHECLAVALISNNNGVIPAERDAPLVRYLVGTHHGRGRPFMPVVPDSTNEITELCHGDAIIRTSCDHRLYRLDSGWTDLFWQMIRRHGYWNLAFLEAMLRLADQAVSDEEQQQE